MRLPWNAIVWIPLMLLTACGASYTTEIPPGTVRPAVDRLFNRFEIQVAQMHLQAFGFDPGLTNGIYNTQTQAAVRAFQATYGLTVSGLLDLQTREVLKVGVGPSLGP